MFRVPKGDPTDLKRFYERSYREGIVTELPSREELKSLVDTGFKGSLRDFSDYIEVLQAAGLKPGAVVLDFGCSWGYGSWQLARAGYKVLSYELSPSRAAFAADKLGCSMISDPSTLTEPVDCFFAAHVIEHLPQPRLIWELAERTVAPSGLVVLFLPNGEPDRSRVAPDAYHSAWGRVHPMLISREALGWMAGQHGFVGTAFSSPYRTQLITAGEEADVMGDELLFVAHRQVT